MTICKQCQLKLPGKVRHDSPADCISALRGRLTIQHSALLHARREHAKKLTRERLSGRVETLETQLEHLQRQVRALEETRGRALARANFAVGQVANARRLAS